jgi:hypothetical protein
MPLRFPALIARQCKWPAGLASPPCSLWSDGKRLELHASQAGRYVVTMPNQQKHLLEIGPLPEPRTVEGPWNVLFPAGWGAPQRIILDKLISWPDSPDAGVRYFSGTAVYKTTFQAVKAGSDCKLFLDLGRVEVIAEVWLNGRPMGTYWKPVPRQNSVTQCFVRFTRASRRRAWN